MRGRIRGVLCEAALVGLGVAAANRAWRLSKVDPDLREPILWLPASLRGPVTLWIARQLDQIVAQKQPDDSELGGVKLTRVDIPGGLDGYLYEPEERVRPSGAVLYTHGGGFILGSPESYHGLCIKLARELEVPVLSTRYRLAPEHRYPAGLDDAMAALRWLHSSAQELGVDPGRVALVGDSAGGGMAATLAQRALDEGVPVAFQALIYPMLDDRTTLRADDEGRGVFVWTAAANRVAWQAYRGVGSAAGRPHSVSGRSDSADSGAGPVRSYFAAARREDLSGLPPAWIGVGDLDLFYLEDLEYARRLRAAGVEVEELVVKGMYHAADMNFADRNELMRDFRTQAVAAIGRAIG